jgi:DNA polymerase III epsilon subunit-like protein
VKIHFLDVETTGLTADDEVIDLAIATWDDGKTDVRYVGRWYPIGPCTPEAARVNGYSPEAWAAAEFPKVGGVFSHEAACHVSQALDGLVLWGGSNPAFDERMLREAFRRVRCPWPKMGHRKVDIASLAAPLLAVGKVKGTGLGQLMAFFGLGEQSHNALADVKASIVVFERLVETYARGIFNVAA